MYYILYILTYCKYNYICNSYNIHIIIAH